MNMGIPVRLLDLPDGSTKNVSKNAECAKLNYALLAVQDKLHTRLIWMIDDLIIIISINHKH